MAAKYTYTIGRRKTASAQVKVFKGKGADIVNGKPVGEYITRTDLFDRVYAPIKLCKLKDDIYFEVKVIGSGESAQAGAIAHGLARSLALDEANRPVLKAE